MWNEFGERKQHKVGNATYKGKIIRALQSGISYAESVIFLLLGE